jgi:hypothetical protein
MMTGMRLTWVVTLTLVLSACGTATETDATDEPSPPRADLPYLTNADGDMLVSCWGRGPGWPVAAMDGGAAGLVDEGDRSAVDEALRAWVEETMMGDAGGPWIPLTTGWLEADDYNGLLEEDAETLVVGLGTWTGEGPG